MREEVENGSSKMASKTKAAEERKKRDPFAYFGGIEELDSEDEVSESDSDEGERETKKLPYISKSSVDENKDKLPAAEEVLLSSGKPAFLNKDDKFDVDWEKLAKDDTKDQEEAIDYTTNAIPPPKTYDPVSEPLKPSIGDTTEEKGNLKRSSLEEDDTKSVKKTKTEDT